MNAPPFVALFAIGLTVCPAFSSPSEADDRPNIIIMMADDMGWSDIGCYGGEINTPLEGVSLKPAFAGDAIARQAPIFWEHEGNHAIRVGDWKLVAKHKGEPELYDLSADRTELTNLAASNPEKVKELALVWQQWANRVGVQPWPVQQQHHPQIKRSVPDNGSL